MDIIPHIDIVDPKRIEALLRDPKNFVWRAVDSETLESWTPDLGLTSYPVPSIFRSSMVAQSNKASTLRQRFWGTVEKQADHTGQRYIGVLVYLTEGEPCPMEVRLASNDVGRVEPRRFDNRLHLIIFDKAVTFIGEMEIFQFIAPGPGTYRIEQFILFKDRPEPIRFKPTIEHLSVQSSSQVNGLWQAKLHFITSEIASAQVRLEVDAQEADKHNETQLFKQSEFTALHTIHLSNLKPDKRYTAIITVTEPGGETETQDINFETRQPTTLAQNLSVPLELINLTDADLKGFPLTFGVPLPQGSVTNRSSCQLVVGGDLQSVQLQTKVVWPDGSARWVLVDAFVPPGLSKKGKAQATLEFSPSTTQFEGLSSQIDKDKIIVFNETLKVTVDRETGLGIERLDKGNWKSLLPDGQERLLSFAAVLGNDLPLSSGKLLALSLKEMGQRRAVIHFVIPHEDEHGVAYLQSVIRVHIFAKQSFVKLVHRLEVISPVLAPAAKGGTLSETLRSSSVGSAIQGLTDEESTLLKLKSFALDFHCHSISSLRTLEQAWDVNQIWQLRHEHDLAYSITENTIKKRQEGRASGHLLLETATGPLGIGIKDFWQSYPKGLTATADTLSIELFPELSGEPLPGDEDAWHRLYFWLREGVYLLKAGMALTSEIMLDVTCQNEAAFAWLEAPLVVRPSLDYLNSTRALYPIGSKNNSPLPAYETLADKALVSFQEDQHHFRAFGQLNFGDWYGESGWSWGNNEYDPAYCAYVEWLRGGDPKWAAWGAQSVRHLVDVDTLNYSADKAEIGGQAMHMPGHLGGYLPPLFHSKMSGTNSIPSHTWVEGPLLHYLLTGDETVHDSVKKTKRWLLQNDWFNAYDFSNCREAGWHIIHLSMLASATNDPNCLNAAAIIVKKVLQRQSPEGGWVRMLTESHCGCGYPRCSGEAGFMVGVLLSGLKRYYHLTADQEVALAIVGGAHWLIKHTFDEKSGHFRYTSCENRTLGGGFQQTQWVLEGLADAYEISGDAEIGAYVKRGLDAIGRFPEGIDHLGFGKAMSQQMRYVPTVLAALQKRPL